MNIRETKGITMISIIVTLIIMMILAAITLNAITDDKDIFSKAENSKVSWEMSQFKEEVDDHVVRLGTHSIEENKAFTITYVENGLQGSGRYDSVVNNGDGTLTVIREELEAIIDLNDL